MKKPVGMAFKLLIKEEANADIVKAYSYYETKKPGLGDRFIQTLYEHFQRIRNTPELFPKKNRNFREAVMSHFPYLIIYRIEDDVIYVLSIFKTWMDPKQKPQ